MSSMCGIFGALNESAALVLVDGLRRLEYRGYDSCGIATVHDGRLYVKKDRMRRFGNRVESVLDVAKRLNFYNLPGRCGVGHTRWATHGVPSKENAHPHLDCRKQIAVVHNGIIDNFLELRDELERSHAFSSQTDTEVFPHLIEELMKDGYNLRESVRRVCDEKIDGSYAIAVVSSEEPDKIILAKNESPLIIGLGRNSVYCASDLPALQPFICDPEKSYGRAIYLRDGEVAELTCTDISVEKTDGTSVNPHIQTVYLQPDAAEKGHYPYFTLKEIEEQPISLKNSMRLPKQTIKIMTEHLNESHEAFSTGCGTSYHACLTGLYLFNKLSHKRVVPVRSSELFEQYGSSIGEETLLFPITQSGETADVLIASKRAKERKAKVMSLTNTLGSSITRISDVYLCQQSGPEIGVGATKTFTSQLSVLFQLALELGRARGMDESEYKEFYRNLYEIPSKVAHLLDEKGKIRKIAKEYKSCKSFYVLGRGINTPSAYEGRLKIMEWNYLPIISYPAGESKHGPISVIEDGFPVICLIQNDETKKEMIGNIMEMKARGARIIGISHDREVYGLCDSFIETPYTPPTLTPLVYAIPLQLFAYYLAVERGCNPDRPRNLAKSVTVK